MAKPVFLFLLVFICFMSFAQSYRVQNAINYYNNNQYDSALYQINFALGHPRTSKYAKTWNHYYLINQALLNQKNLDKSDSLNHLNLMIDAYTKCKNLDEKNEYTPKLTTLIQPISEYFGQKAQANFENYRLVNFAKNQELYAAFLEALGKPYLAENYKLAEAHHDLDNYDQAIHYFQKSINLNYESENAYIEMMEVFIDMGNQDLVDSLYEKAIIAFPKSTKLIFLEIGQNIAKKLYYRARIMLLEALETNPNIADLYLMLGEVNDNLDRPEEAQEAYKMSAKLAGSNFDICLKVGQYFLKCGKEKNEIEYFETAKKYLEKSETLYDQDTLLLASLKTIYLKLGDEVNYQRVINKLNK